MRMMVLVDGGNDENNYVVQKRDNNSDNNFWNIKRKKFGKDLGQEKTCGSVSGPVV